MRRPLLWLAASWIAGMCVAAHADMLWVAAGSVAAALAAWAANGPSRNRRWIALAAALAFLIGGGRFAQFEAASFTRVPLPPEAEAAAVLSGVIASLPELDGDRIVFDLAVEQMRLNGVSTPLFGEKVKIYIRFESEAERQTAAKWERGDEAIVFGELRPPMEATNFGGFDYRLYLRRQHIFWTAHAKGLGGVIVSPSTDGSFYKAAAWVDRVRRGMGERIDALYPQPVSGFMKGLIIGVTEDLDPERYREFSQIGLTHILAISGLHVAIYVGSILWLLARLPLTRESRLTIAMAAVPVYVVLTGASPSVVRAGIMAVISLYAARRGLLKDGLHVLALAAVGMLAWDPYYLFNVSFQLSFIVTAGLIIGVPLLNEWIRLKRPAIQSALSVTLAAQFASFPLTVYYFNQFSVLSFLANLVMVPLYSLLILPLGSVTLVLAYLHMPLASALAAVNRLLTEISFTAVERLADVERAITIWPTPPVWWVAAYYAVWIAGLAAAAGKLSLGKDSPNRLLALPFGLIFSLLLLYGYAPDLLDRSGSVAFIDVGQGDAIWIRTPYGKQLLIDAGGTLRFMKPGDEWKIRKDPFEVGRDVVVPLLMKRGVHSLDAVFLSHADMDHIGGLAAVLDAIPVRRLFFNGTLKENETVQQVLREALDKGVPLTPLSSGMRVRIDPVSEICVLYPEPVPDPVVRPDQNAVSLVFVLKMYSKTFLFTGDISAAEERKIIEKLKENAVAGDWDLTKTDVLKIAHHGSKSSTAQEWLDYWDPAVAVVSVGRTNIYGHPHPTVVERLDRGRIPTLRTDLHGEIQFRVTKDSFQMRTKLAGEPNRSNEPKEVAQK